MVLQKHYLDTAKITTVYFGGGTPSLLTAGEFREIWDELEKNYYILPEAEITLEANPDDLSASKIAEWRQSRVNRFSIGIQSLYEEDLRYMNRAHTAREAIECVQIARDAGFEKLSIDLIYGTPTLSDQGWSQNLAWVIEEKIPHLSAYCLTVEERTPLHKMVARKHTPIPDEAAAIRHFEILMDTLPAAGYEHYEISNLCRPGAYSKHNTAYWQNQPYLGLGPSAHSFDGHTRQSNVRNNARYIKSLAAGNLDMEIEILTHAQRCNEYILTTLRTRWGCDIEEVKLKCTREEYAQFEIYIHKFINSGWLSMNDGHITLTREGKLMADHISRELFI